MKNERLRYVIKDVNGITLVLLCEILYLLADRNYTTLVMADGTRHTQSGWLGYHLRQLGSDFCSISRGCAVNLHHAQRVENSGTITLSGDTCLDVDRKKLPQVKRAMSEY